MSFRKILPIAGIIFIWAILFIPGVGLKELWNPIEPRYAAVAKEMYETKQFLIPHYLGEVYLEKPPLYFWLIDLSFYVTGKVEVWSALIPSLLSSLGSLILIYLIGANLFSSGGGLIAAALTLFNIRFAYMSNRIQMEMLLLFFILLAIYSFIKWLNGKKNIWVFVLYIALGLSILTKGLIGVIPVLISIIIYSLIDKNLKFKEIKLPLGILIMLGVLSLWLIPAFFIKFGPFEAYTLFMNGVGRFLTESSKHTVFYYFRILPTEFLPWTIFAIPALIDRGRAIIKERDHNSIFLFLILISTFIFLSINSKRHSHYSILMIPILSLIVANWVHINKESKIFLTFIRITVLSSLITIPLLLAGYYIAPNILKATEFVWITPYLLNLPIPTLLLIMSLGVMLCLIGTYRKLPDLRKVYSGILVYFCGLIYFVNVPLMKVFDPIKSNATVRNELGGITIWQKVPLGTFGFLNNSESLLGWFYFYTGRQFHRLNDRDIEAKHWLEYKNNHLLLFQQDLERVKRNVSDLKIEAEFDFGKNEKILLVRKLKNGAS